MNSDMYYTWKQRHSVAVHFLNTSNLLQNHEKAGVGFIPSTQHSPEQCVLFAHSQDLFYNVSQKLGLIYFI